MRIDLDTSGNRAPPVPGYMYRYFGITGVPLKAEPRDGGVGCRTDGGRCVAATWESAYARRGSPQRALLVGLAGGPCWWALLVGLAGGPCWWALRADIGDRYELHGRHHRST
jgi:hypothetical protein